MKILIVTQNAPLYLAEFLDDLLKKINHKGTCTVAGIIVLKPFFRKNILLDIWDRYQLYGTKDFLIMLAKILSNKLKSFFFYYSSHCYSINNFVRKYEIDVLSFKNVSSKLLVDHVKSNDIDLIISIASPQIFNHEILSAPQNGCINYHTSLLPVYRGRQPLFWAMKNNEKKTGITVHEMDNKLDNGPIIYQQSFDILDDDSLHDLYIKSIKIGADVLYKSIEIMQSKKYLRIDNNPDFATYFGFPKKTDAIIFRKNNRKFF